MKIGDDLNLIPNFLLETISFLFIFQNAQTVNGLADEN